MPAAYAHFRQHLQVLAHYRAELLIWNVLGALQMLVYYSVWAAVAESQGGTVGEYGSGTFAAYYITLLILRRIQMPSIMWKLSGEVRRGEFDARLLRPYHPAMAIHTSEIGAAGLGLVNYLVFGIPLALLFHASFDGSAAAMFAVGALLPLIVTTRYLFESLIATLAFRFTRIEGVRSVYLVGLIFLGGQFAPIALVPGWFEAVARALPFYWVLGFPVELFIGTAPVEEAILGAGVLAAWTAVLYVAFKLAWARGLRALETVGT